jgi:hypothetical protein
LNNQIAGDEDGIRWADVFAGYVIIQDYPHGLGAAAPHDQGTKQPTRRFSVVSSKKLAWQKCTTRTLRQ